MATAEEVTLLEETTTALERIQQYKVEELVQDRRLGELSFEGIVEPAQRLITLFKRIPVSALSVLGSTELDSVKTQANTVFALFDEVRKFDVNEPDPKARRLAQIEKVTNAYQRIFSNLHPIISYSMAMTVDFNQLADQGRAAVQDIRDKTDELLVVLDERSNEAQRILEEVRNAAAEQGVTQQASYFKLEADRHADQATFWRVWTVRVAAIVIAYGVLAIFLHKWTWLAPTTTAEAIQFTSSKLLVFFVLAYLLFLCSRNFMSNRHNEIVNRHRQNSPMTYKALVDAGGAIESRDIVLNHAASSIYKLHDTGYTKSQDFSDFSSTSVVGMLPKLNLPSGGSGG